MTVESASTAIGSVPAILPGAAPAPVEGAFLAECILQMQCATEPQAEVQPQPSAVADTGGLAASLFAQCAFPAAALNAVPAKVETGSSPAIADAALAMPQAAVQTGNAEAASTPAVSQTPALSLHRGQVRSQLRPKPAGQGEDGPAPPLVAQLAIPQTQPAAAPEDNPLPGRAAQPESNAPAPVNAVPVPNEAPPPPSDFVVRGATPLPVAPTPTGNQPDVATPTSTLAAARTEPPRFRENDEISMSDRQSGGEISLTRFRGEAAEVKPAPTVASLILSTAPAALHNVRTEAPPPAPSIAPVSPGEPQRPAPTEPPAVLEPQLPERPLPQASAPAVGAPAETMDNVAFVVRVSDERHTEQGAAVGGPSYVPVRTAPDAACRTAKPGELKLSQEMDPGGSPAFGAGARTTLPADPKAAAAPVARASAPLLPDTTPEAAPVRQILLRIDGQGAQAAQVKLSQRGGDVVVSVRGSDPAVVDSLRQNLPELVSKINAHGVKADVWQPASASSSGDSRERDEQRRSAPEQDKQDSGPQQQHDSGSRRGRQRWLEEDGELAMQLPRRLSK